MLTAFAALALGLATVDLYGVRSDALDSVSLVAGPAILILVALIVSLVPARRAGSLDLVAALKVE